MGRRLGAALALLCLLATGCSSSFGEAEPAAPTTIPTPTGCPPSHLLLSTADRTERGDLRTIRLVVTNCSAAPVSLRGYPHVRVFQDGGDAPHYVILHLGDVPDPGPATLTIAPRGRAVSLLAWRSTLQDVGIEPIEGDALVVDLGPTGEPPQEVAATVDLGSTGQLQVTAWRAG